MCPKPWPRYDDLFKGERVWKTNWRTGNHGDGGSCSFVVSLVMFGSYYVYDCVSRINHYIQKSMGISNSQYGSLYILNHTAKRVNHD